MHIQGKLKQAEKLYRAILSGDAGYLGALNNFGIVCFQLGDYKSAATFTRDVIRLPPGLADGIQHLGDYSEIFWPISMD